jgi:enoyl-CoA hydratase
MLQLSPNYTTRLRHLRRSNVQLETMYSEVRDEVATLVLNRPDVLNCANEQWTHDLNVLVDDLAEHHHHARVVIVRGAGRAFCSGIDLTALAHGEIELGFFERWESALRKIEMLDAVVIAAIQSHCIGGGLQVALACDLRIARDDARFGVTAVKEGIIPGMGMWRIARHAGLGRAKRLAIAADVIDAAAALEWGLVDWVVPADQFEGQITSLTERVLSTAVTSTRLTKKLTNLAFDLPFDECLATYLDYQRQSLHSPEHQQAMAHHRAARSTRNDSGGVGTLPRQKT